MRKWIDLVENVNEVIVYHGTGIDDHRPHAKQFFSTDRTFAENYGSTIYAYRLNQMEFIDTADPEFAEAFFPFYDHFSDQTVNTIDGYMERLNDTWAMVEDKADEIVEETDAAGLIVYEGGIKNFLVYDTSVLTPITR